MSRMRLVISWAVFGDVDQSKRQRRWSDRREGGDDWVGVGQSFKKGSGKFKLPHAVTLRGSRGFKVGLTRAKALCRGALMSLSQHCHGLPLAVIQRHQGTWMLNPGRNPCKLVIWRKGRERGH